MCLFSVTFPCGLEQNATAAATGLLHLSVSEDWMWRWSFQNVFNGCASARTVYLKEKQSPCHLTVTQQFWIWQIKYIYPALSISILKFINLYMGFLSKLRQQVYKYPNLIKISPFISLSICFCCLGERI